MKKVSTEYDRFLASLNEEKLQAQERRAQFTIRKLAFVGALFAAGTVKLPQGIELTLVLYIVPFISIAFDLYVLGEDYGIKRMGAFVLKQLDTEIEAEWERYVAQRRDPFTNTARSFLSLLVMIACAVVLWQSAPSLLPFGIWIASNLLAIIIMAWYARRQRLHLVSETKEQSKSANGG